MKYQLKRDSVVTVLQSKYSILDEEGALLYEAKPSMLKIKKNIEFSQGGGVVAVSEKNFGRNIYSININGQEVGAVKGRFSLTVPYIITLNNREYKVKKSVFGIDFKVLEGEKEVAKVSQRGEEKKSFTDSLKGAFLAVRYISIDDEVEQLPLLVAIATVEIGKQEQARRTRRR